MIPWSKGTYGTYHCQNWPSRLIQPERECPARSVNAGKYEGSDEFFAKNSDKTPFLFSV